MFDSGSKLKHLPFFEELAALEENSDAWNSATAGLVTLRLVDAWLESGAGNAADDEWNFKSVCAAIENVSERTATRSLLTSVLLSIREGKPSIRAVVPSLMAYAKSLEWDAQWELAADVYSCLLSHLHPREDSSACIDAHQRLGFCHLSLTQLDRALGAYASVFEIGNATGDVEAVLRARMGEGEVAILRGNLPKAASQFDAVIAEAPADRFRDVRARALFSRASVAALTDQYDLSIRLGYESLRLQDSPTQRDRTLANIAAGFLSLGVYSAARDAYLVLSVTAREQYTRWNATMNLLELSARTGSEIHFEQYNRQLAGEALTPQFEAAYQLTVGEGLHRFGHTESARHHLERAIDLSRRFGLGQYLIIAEKTLADLNKPVPAYNASAAMTAEVERVAGAIRDLRELAGVG